METMIVMSFLILSMTGCYSARDHQDRVFDDPATQNLTVGTVQKEIRTGMSSAQVAEVLGSPNIVSTDEQRNEVWIYDKVSSEVSYSKSNDLATLILLGTSKSQGASMSQQKTLTVIIKFDAEGKVRDFAYHSSKF